MIRITRTVEFSGPAEQVDYILSKVIGLNGFDSGRVRIRKLENKDLLLTKAEIDVILHGLNDLEARVSNEYDTLIDSIREKLNVQRNSHSG